MNKPNLHVALALALGVQPDRSDAQLIALVEKLRAQAQQPCPQCHLTTKEEA